MASLLATALGLSAAFVLSFLPVFVYLISAAMDPDSARSIESYLSPTWDAKDIAGILVVGALMTLGLAAFGYYRNFNPPPGRPE